jgi:hypothetical protein
VSPARRPVSIICVFNDAPVREHCLDSSIERHRTEVDDLDYVMVDNRDGAFLSAGAAFNAGATRARHDHLVFVHQDVVLHSLAALERAAATLDADPGIGLAGAIGVEHDGRLVGRIRDRVVLLGKRTNGAPVDVDAIDELLFIVPRRVFDHARLSEAPTFAWHAYAVEYGLRLRRNGLRVCAVDVPLTHNSLSQNVEDLDAAHAEIARTYADALPVQTTTQIVPLPGLIGRIAGLIPQHAWRVRWLRESVAAHLGRRLLGSTYCLLGDIRMCIDDLLAIADPLLTINLDREGTFVEDRPDPLVLRRLERELHVTSGGVEKTIASIRAAPEGINVLVSGLTFRDLRALARHVSHTGSLLGYRGEVGYWLLVGPSVPDVAARLRSRRSTPVGMGRDAT